MANNEAEKRPLDRIIRWSSLAGVVLLVVRRAVYLVFPNFLPSRNWIPTSSISRWAAAITNGLFEMLIILILLSVPFFLYFYLRLYWRCPKMRHLSIDVASAVGLYATAWFLLSPPA